MASNSSPLSIQIKPSSSAAKKLQKAFKQVAVSEKLVAIIDEQNKRLAKLEKPPKPPVKKQK